jgi:hypothetical protein
MAMRRVLGLLAVVLFAGPASQAGAKNSRKLEFSLAPLAQWSGITSRNTQLEPPSHGHEVRARHKPRLRTRDVVSKCRPRKGRHEDLPCSDNLRRVHISGW